VRLTLGKAEQGIGDGVPVNWGEGLAGSVAEGAQSITVQVRAASAFVHYFVGKVCFLFYLLFICSCVSRVPTTSPTTSCCLPPIFPSPPKVTVHHCVNARTPPFITCVTHHNANLPCRLSPSFQRRRRDVCCAGGGRGGAICDCHGPWKRFRLLFHASQRRSCSSFPAMCRCEGRSLDPL
jgi:hypothetical protein